MKEKIVGFLRGQILTSIVYILLGAAFVFVPVESVNVICKIVFGIMLIAAGAWHILLYILEKPVTTMLDLFSGVILVVFGIFLFHNPQVIVKVLPTLLGGFILVDCAWTLRGTFRLKKAGSGAWKWVLLGTAVFVGLGIAMIINPFTVVRYTILFCGCVLLANGIVDLIFQLVVYRGLKNAKRRAEELAQTAEQAEAVADSGEPVYEEWDNRDSTEEDVEVSDWNEAESEEPFEYTPELTLEPESEEKEQEDTSKEEEEE